MRRSCALALEKAGGQVEIVPAVEHLPDLVFPANAAIVLDGRALVARFRYPERQGEEAIFRATFLDLKARGLLAEVIELPDGVLQEGAGDCIWDADRSFFWAGYGQRSTENSLPVIEDVFGQRVVGLRLATDRFYHLDTCFCPLAGGKVLYYPAAFTAEALATIRAHVRPEDRIEATDEEAGRLLRQCRQYRPPDRDGEGTGTPCASSCARWVTASPKSISRRSSFPAAAPIA